MHNQIMLDNYNVNYQVFFKNNKHMYLRIKPYGLQITSPKGLKKRQIEAFIKKNKSWIIQHLTDEESKIKLYDQKEMFLWGELYPVVHQTLNRSVMSFSNQVIYLNRFDKLMIEQFYHESLMKEMKNLLQQNHQLLSQYFDLYSVTLKTQLMKSRLGSCQVKKRVIKLNTILARIDRKYTKLVLFHELTHLIYPNHSKKFHRFLEKLYPNHRSINRKLNKIIRQFSMTDRPMKA